MTFLVLLPSLAAAAEALKPDPQPAPPVKHRNVQPAISTDGRYVVFQSTTRDLLPGDAGGTEHVYVYSRERGWLSRVSTDSAGKPGNRNSYGASISGDGRVIAFASDATNLVPGDTNSKEDVFVHDRKTARTTRVSIDSAGKQADNASRDPCISGSGRYVVFVSTAANLVPGDTNSAADVFLHDRKTHKTRRISVDSAGKQANAGSGEPAISGDGRFAVFYSHATNLVPGDSNGWPDIFVHDLRSGKVARVSVNSAGKQGNGDSRRPATSGDGRFVAFESWATNLVPEDTNNAADIFIRDLKGDRTTRVSVDSSGKQGDQNTRDPAISLDGRFVVFTGYAENLVPNDANGWADVFVHDRETRQTARVSVSSAGTQGNKASAEGSISADGRYVAFAAKATNLVPDDHNHAVDILIHDRQTGKTIRISAAPATPREPRPPAPPKPRQGPPMP